MEELTKAVIALSKESFFDYAIVVVPLLLSIVAICISVFTAHKQNKIALFDLRYQCLSQIKSIVTFDNGAYDCEEPTMIWFMIEALWRIDLSPMSIDEKLKRVKNMLEQIKKDVFQVQFLFGDSFDSEIADLFTQFQAVVISSFTDEDSLEARKALHNVCLGFMKNTYPKLVKDCKLSSQRRAKRSNLGNGDHFAK